MFVSAILHISANVYSTWGYCHLTGHIINVNKTTPVPCSGVSNDCPFIFWRMFLNLQLDPNHVASSFLTNLIFFCPSSCPKYTCHCGLLAALHILVLFCPQGAAIGLSLSIFLYFLQGLHKRHLLRKVFSNHQVRDIPFRCAYHCLSLPSCMILCRWCHLFTPGLSVTLE